MTGHCVLDLAPRRSVVPHEHQGGASTEPGPAGAKVRGGLRSMGAQGA